jgi:hypothetical protein
MSPELGRPVMADPQPFVEGSQTDTSPQLTVPEGEKGGMVGPGQEGIVEEFAKEQEQLQEEEAILGKFKSPQDLAKAYAELQRKMGQQSAAEPQSEPVVEPEATEEPGYSADQASEVYGKEAVDLLAGKGVNLAELMWNADQGGDISEHYDTLAETFKVPRQVVENYVSKAQSASSAGEAGLSDADATELLQSVGGQENFDQLSGWARSNLPAEELASYNAVVDSGNKEAIGWALKAMQARQVAPDSVVEPQLYGGGTPTDTVVRFESQQQVLDAMNKRNDRGQRLYDVDEAYRNKVAMILHSSPDF